MTRAIFFYGLFMSPDHRPKDVALGRRVRACVEGWRLVVEARATLVQEPGARALGMIEWLDDAALNRLYDGPAMAAYRPVEVTCTRLDGGDEVAALAWIAEPGGAAADPDYLARLRDAMRGCGLPEEAWQGL
jgi:hypothetical protein